MLADCVKAAIGVVFEDFGFEEVRSLVTSLVEDVSEHIPGGLTAQKQSATAPIISSNSKGQLQEALQKISRGAVITYEVIEESGPPHKRLYRVNCRVNNHVLAVGAGNSKKNAELEAAKSCLVSWAQSNKYEDFWEGIVDIERKSEKPFGL